jgi:hypothetical protein
MYRMYHQQGNGYGYQRGNEEKAAAKEGAEAMDDDTAPVTPSGRLRRHRRPSDSDAPETLAHPRVVTAVRWKRLAKELEAAANGLANDHSGRLRRRVGLLAAREARAQGCYAIGLEGDTGD